jgi:F-type H+/Na+-transporting ATPase subunit beta
MLKMNASGSTHSREKTYMAATAPQSHRAGGRRGVGRVVQVIGPVIDAEFDEGQMPDIYNALRDPPAGAEGARRSTSRSRCSSTSAATMVRAVAMSSTDGVVRGMEVVDTGARSPCPSARRRWAASST